jgi:hypothetical protein
MSTFIKRTFNVCLTALAVTTAYSALKADQLIYHDMSGYPLLGTLAPNAEKAYSRLPDSLNGKIRDDVWRLGKNSAGLAIRFSSDASTIGASWKSLNKFNMNHMTATGIRGLDLYVRQDDGTWTTVGSARPAYNDHKTRTVIMTDMEPRMRDYMLYLSLYDGVDSVYIGTDSLALVMPPIADSPRRAKPIVMYGTSILQGGCASRPGMCHTSQLERRLDREVINLGFSGNAKLDYEIADLIAATDASIIVLDPLPNLKTPELVERMPHFFEIVRKAHPTTPIILVESPIFPLMRFNTETNQTITEKNAALKVFYDAQIAAGDKNLYYFKGEDVLGGDPETTVDNYHLTDLGFTRFADALYPLMKQLLDQ